MKPWLAPALLLCLAIFAPACVYSDLDLSGKRCDPATPCPGELICVEIPVSEADRVGTCHNPTEIQGCAAGTSLCEPSGAWIQTCEPDGYSWRVSQACASPTVCNPDTLICSYTCSADSDCGASETCDRGTDLCRPLPTCEDGACDGLCVKEVCVPTAPGDATSATGSPDLDCFLDVPSRPSASPPTCMLTGRVNLFPAKDNSDQSIGLTVKLLQAMPPYAELDQVLVTQGADDFGYYSFDGVATNASYFIEVQSGSSDTDIEVVTTLNAPVELRADACLAGTATVGISAMTAQTFETYTTGTIESLDPSRGLVIGRVQDCHADTRRPLGKVTVSLGIGPVEPGRVFYFPDETYLIPDLALAATSVKGYYAAAGVPATRNQVAFAARQGVTDLVLGAVDFFLRPGAAAIIDLPLPETRLSE